MRLATAVACIALLASPAALAGGSDYVDAISVDEAARLLKSLSELEGKYAQAAAPLEKLKKDPDVFKSAPLTRAASAALKSHATVGVFLAQLRDGLMKRDLRAHAYELELKGEIDELESNLAALRDQAERNQAPTVRDAALAALAVAAELDTRYLIFDANYEVAVAELDPLLLPAVDVYAAVRFQDPFLGSLPSAERARWESAQAGEP